MDPFLQTTFCELAIFCLLDSFLRTVEQDLLSSVRKIHSFLWTVEQDLLSSVREIFTDWREHFPLPSSQGSLNGLKIMASQPHSQLQQKKPAGVYINHQQAFSIKDPYD